MKTQENRESTGRIRHEKREGKGTASRDGELEKGCTQSTPATFFAIKAVHDGGRGVFTGGCQDRGDIRSCCHRGHPSRNAALPGHLHDERSIIGLWAA
jgi:hypothetical protein